jgi:hypothetical protein
MNTKLDTCGSATRVRNTKYEIRNTKNGPVLHSFSEGGFVLPLVLFGIVILMALIIGSAMTSYNSRLQAVQTKSQTEAMLAAEAGYEKAIFWMSQRTDLLGDIQAGGGNDSINFGSGTCSYEIDFHGFIGARPVFRVTSTGISGRPSFTRVVDVDVVQETSGWAMGTCRIPIGSSSTMGVNFINGEIIDMPLHINKADDSPDIGDIFISGSPTFLQKVEMGEDRKIGSTDKNIYTQTTSGLTLIGNYSTIMPLFKNGIDFDQPNIRVTDATAVQSKVTRFQNSTLTAYKFTPNLTGCPTTSPFNSSSKCPAVQLEFFVQGGVGMVRITNNCAVVLNNPGPYDYNIVTGSNPTTFNTYKIYGYHYRPNDAANQTTVPITNTYTTQTIGDYTSDPGGQIYVNGNVIIGGDSNATLTDPNQVVKGKITVVATGNIWIADSIRVDDNGGTQRDVNGMPKPDNPNSNPNVLGLIAQGVIKVVDPGLSPTAPSSVTGYTYQPIGNSRTPTGTYPGRWLPNPTVVEASLTIGGGGWGAEDVSYRRQFSGSCSQDTLTIHGSITEVIRGVIGLSGGCSNGYTKDYHIDTRLMSGILPGDIWFSGKYIPAPAGWHDHSAD